MARSGLVLAFAAWASMVTITQAGNESHAGNASTAISPLLLVSFDGFRADYLEKYPLPNLREFHSDGVLVDHITNVFITKTFPNHYSLVTGLYAESHGILASTMYDPVMNRTFSVHNHSIDAVWWNEATPIWVSVQNSGYKTAAAMWPGSDVPIQNKTPTYFMKYDSKVSFRDRVVNLTESLVRDEAVRFAVLYWEEPDNAGHTYGPDNVTEMTKALKEVDDNIGFLMQQLKSKGLWDKINVIVTSDHGMTQCSPDRLIQLDKCLNASAYTLVDETPVAAVLPRTNDTFVFNSLSKCHSHMKAYMKTDIPDRLHYKNNVRIQPIILVADEGWTIVQNEKHLRLGDHGYDNSLPSMHPFLAAHGPAFRKGYRLPHFNSVDIYPLMCHLLGISEKPNNGSFSNTRCLLASESCLDLASVIGIVIGSLMVLTTVTCLFVFIRNRVPNSSRPFARLELQEDDDDDPLID